MTASRRALLVLLGIALLLGGLVARELRRPPPARDDRSLVPGLDPERITALAWQRVPAVTVSRAGADWSWTSGGATARADAAAVRAVLAALRAGRWQRRGEAALAGPVGARLAITGDGPAREIGIGAALAGTEQRWLVVEDRALLVDAWIARALDPDPLALRERHLVTDAAHAPQIVIAAGATRLWLEGEPRQLVPPRVLVNAALVGPLERALDELEIVRLSRAPTEGPPAISVDVRGVVRLSPTCPDDPALAWASAPTGDGCVVRATYDAIAAAITGLAGPPAQIAEPRPAPGEIVRVTLPDGRLLDLARAPTVDGERAEPVAVAELLAVLAAPAEIVHAPPRATARTSLAVTPRGGAPIALELLGDSLVRRAGEPFALRLSSAAYLRLARASSAYVDTAAWTEDPLSISSLQVDGVTFARGAVIGEWTRSPLGAFDPRRVDALVAALAAPRHAAGQAPRTITHRVTLTVTPPVGPPIVHELAVEGARCLASTANGTLGLERSVCDALDALARSR